MSCHFALDMFCYKEVVFKIHESSVVDFSEKGLGHRRFSLLCEYHIMWFVTSSVDQRQKDYQRLQIDLCEPPQPPVVARVPFLLILMAVSISSSSVGWAAPRRASWKRPSCELSLPNEEDLNCVMVQMPDIG